MYRVRAYLLPLLVLATAFILYGIIRVADWGTWCIVVLLLALIGTSRDAKAIGWIRFLPAGLITLAVFYVIYQYANPMWHRFIGMETQNVHHIFRWNEVFRSIPFNDAAVFRIWQPKWLTKYMQWVYAFGFTLSYWICVIRAFFTKDVKKMGLYSLAGYLLQVPLILLFYNTILLQEVWYVEGTPDLLERGLTGNQAYMAALNCFPSMHTSIAFAAILLAMRERSRWYRWLIGVYCSSIILSTMYLKVHWMLDVVGGMLFAYGCVKLADRIVGAKFYEAFIRRFEGLGERLEAWAGVRANASRLPNLGGMRIANLLPALAVCGAAGVLVYLLLVRPLIGVADNGDFARIMGSIGLNYADAGESFHDRFFGYAHFQYAYVKIKLGGYLSTEVPLVMAVVGAGRLAGVLFGSRTFDIRWLGVAYSAFYLFALYALVGLTVRYMMKHGDERLRPGSAGAGKVAAAVLLTAIVVVMFTDVGYAAYFNSLFGEPLAYVSLLIAVASGLRLSQESRPRYVWLAGFFIAALFLAGSKTQYAPVGVLFAIAGWRLRGLHADRRWRRSAAIGAVALVLASGAFYALAPKELRQINEYQTVFNGILKLSPTPERDLQELGLDPKLAVLKGSNFFTKDLPISPTDRSMNGMFYERISHVKVAIFYLKHPMRFMAMVSKAAEEGMSNRPYYLGSYEAAAGRGYGAVSDSFSLWSRFKRDTLPHGLWFQAAVLLLFVFGLVRRYLAAGDSREKRALDMGAVLVGTAAISFVVPISGDGLSDIGKHLFLYNVVFDLIVAAEAVWLAKSLAGAFTGRRSASAEPKSETGVA